MLAGALLSCFLTPYMAIPIYIIWLVLFFREVHFDNRKFQFAGMKNLDLTKKKVQLTFFLYAKELGSGQEKRHL